MFSASSVFYFGFVLALPTALRPFLDGAFFANLSLQFFGSVAVAAVFARLLVLSLRLFAARFPDNFLSQFSAGLNEFFSFFVPLEVDPLSVMDRQLKVRMKLLARWVRRQNLIVTSFIGLAVFAWLFLGRLGFLFILFAILIAPFLWVAISLVELRRQFATAENTRQFSNYRVVRAIALFLTLYISICVFLAGMTAFQSRLASQVSVGIAGQERQSSILAVTSQGIIVGERAFPNDPFRAPLAISAHFLPFGSIQPIGQRNFAIDS